MKIAIAEYFSSRFKKGRNSWAPNSTTKPSPRKSTKGTPSRTLLNPSAQPPPLRPPLPPPPRRRHLPRCGKPPPPPPPLVHSRCGLLLSSHPDPPPPSLAQEQCARTAGAMRYGFTPSSWLRAALYASNGEVVPRCCCC